jgi:hypothetical protein
MGCRNARNGWLPDLPDQRGHFYAAPVARTGHVSLPKSGGMAIGGHAVAGAGCDEAKQWFMVRNSWGGQWGVKGCFTLPCAQVTDDNLAVTTGQSVWFNDS